MLIYYLATRPETIRAIVNTGQLPESLPHRLRNEKLVLFHNITSSIRTSSTSYHQTFLLKLIVPILKNSRQLTYFPLGTKQYGSVVASSLNTNWIQSIIVYSEKSCKLVNRLLKGCRPMSIEHNSKFFSLHTPTIDAGLFSANNLTNMKRKHVDIEKTTKKGVDVYAKETTHPPPKRRKILSKEKKSHIPKSTLATYTHQTFFRIREKQPASQKINFSLAISENNLLRLSTRQEHLNALEYAFKIAKNSILVTSYSINHETLQSANLYNLIQSVSRRGIRIYFYYNDQKFVDHNILNFLEYEGVYCDQAYTHSKILAVDRTFMASGSFNWLSAVDYRFNPCEDGSIVCQSDLCELLIDDFWKHLKFYRNVQFGNSKSVRSFQRNPYNCDALLYQFDDCYSDLCYLPTLEQHQNYLQEAFERATEKIIICSPFISNNAEYEYDIDLDLLRLTSQRGVQIIFVCSEQSQGYAQSNFLTFLRQANCPNVHLFQTRNFHLKTIIVDDSEIAEGSFNWLSAVRDSNSQFHNHEATIVIEGPAAKALIEHFYESNLGKELASHFNFYLKETLQQRNGFKV